MVENAPARKPKSAVQRRADYMHNALRYFRGSQWTEHPERIVMKAGRMAIRLLAMNQVLKETDGLVLLAPSTESALQQLIHSDRRSQ